MANNPNAIPVAVMYAYIVFLLTATGSGMAGRQPPSLLAISAAARRSRGVRRTRRPSASSRALMSYKPTSRAIPRMGGTPPCKGR
jgi:hypothetical protein